MKKRQRKKNIKKYLKAYVKHMKIYFEYIRMINFIFTPRENYGQKFAKGGIVKNANKDDNIEINIGNDCSKIIYIEIDKILKDGIKGGEVKIIR